MPVANNPSRELLDSEFPENYRPFVPAALKRAYAAADHAYEVLDFLGTPSGRFHRGDLIVLAVEMEFARLVGSGHLPFETTYEAYANPTGKHLVMRSPKVAITLSQVEYPHQKPRFARFRDVLAVPNTSYLFPEWNEELERDQSRRHILLLHGYGQLRFATLAIPHPTLNELIWWTDDLMDLPHEVPTEVSKGEGPTESPEAELVEEILREVRSAKND